MNFYKKIKANKKKNWIYHNNEQANGKKIDHEKIGNTNDYNNYYNKPKFIIFFSPIISHFIVIF